ncbi:type II toxin-antitoxin system RelE/ParE family toxin [Ruminobacter sp. RM87]|uniref:type II toxin-antitoxin system RelE family toxin n=1 Tax=Ruminobacter sp. RM87 TaxID=1200567 RepID=UPI0004E27608|nr:type II toxin-antitoxin system RelE/ParE family toxin [Ruminobacter sp. RM87]
MSYSVLFTQKAKKQLSKLDRNTAKLIASWLKKNLEGCVNPRIHGKALVANKAGQWRYRVGDYRILAEIRDEEVIILVLQIGLRREIYK